MELNTRDLPATGSRGGHGAAARPVAAQMEGGKKERKLLYYRNPMGLPDTSPTPKKDPMGMDYVPVYEGDICSVRMISKY